MDTQKRQTVRGKVKGCAEGWTLRKISDSVSLKWPWDHVGLQLEEQYRQHNKYGCYRHTVHVKYQQIQMKWVWLKARIHGGCGGTTWSPNKTNKRNSVADLKTKLLLLSAESEIQHNSSCLLCSHGCGNTYYDQSFSSFRHNQPYATEQFIFLIRVEKTAELI